MPMVQNVVFPVTVPNSLRFHVLEQQNIMLSGVCRIKSRDNRDKRVKYMEYAVQVETYTLSKAKNLVLNVDGAIGSLFLDLLVGSGVFTKQEINEIVQVQIRAEEMESCHCTATRGKMSCTILVIKSFIHFHITFVRRLIFCL